EIKKILVDQQDNFQILVDRIVGDKGKTVKDRMKDLFPIHPYSAYLATFIARYIGSTERSIFSFLYDEKKGFSYFLNKEITTDYFLTGDYLWDFFVNDFERDPELRFSTVIEKFKLYKDILEEKGSHYLSIFKGILLLNILYRVVKIDEHDSGLSNPSIDNIKAMFSLSSYENYVDEVLEYIEGNNIIPKTPEDLFLIEFSSLPSKEVEREKERLKKEYDEIVNLLDSDNKKSIVNFFTNGVLRESETMLYSATEKEHILRNKLKRDFNNSYTIHNAVFLLKDKGEKPLIEATIEKISKEDEFKDIIFFILDEPLEENNLTRFIEYMARKNVAMNHRFMEDATNHNSLAKKIVDDWINSIRNGLVEIIFRGKRKSDSVKNIVDLINSELSTGIFTYGMEKLPLARENQNIWTFKNAKKVVEAFLFANTRSELENKTRRAPDSFLRSIIKNNQNEYIVKEDFELKSNVEKNHPLIHIIQRVDEILKEAKKNTIFNLGELLSFLAKPPFGLYTNMVNMATLAFVMKRYIGKLYEANSGRPIDAGMMKEKILNLFNYWQAGRDGQYLDVRFGTEEENQLVKLLKYIFNLKEVEGITDVKWAIRKWINEKGFPLWSLKYLKLTEGVKNLIKELIFLTRSIDEKLKHEWIIDTLNRLKYNKNELKIHLNPIKLKEGFEEFIKSKKIHFSDNDFDKIIEHLKNHMPSEISLWEENDVEIKLKDWIIEGEEKLIKLLKEIFNLKDVESLRSVIWSINKDWVNKIGFPLWSLKYLNIDKNLKTIISELYEFTTIIEKEDDHERIKSLLEKLEYNKEKIKSIVNEKKLREGFLLFIKDNVKKDINDEKFREIIGYLKRHISDDISSWNEEKVVIRLNDWAKETEGYKEKTKKTKNLLENYKGDLIKLLFEILDRHPEISDIFLYYLENNKANSSDIKVQEKEKIDLSAS
ncbi:MAG: hypothetical protein JRI44_11560, partial [Deltaproteobacteria bacterium]|nr:hypothetical protein [Deltaproteobacteria bacterium]